MIIPESILAGWHVLIVDDDEGSLEIAEILLMHAGAVVHTAKNGQDALQRLQSTQPKFILSDIAMPVMDGWQMIEAIKADRHTANIPVIALTAHGSLADRQRAMAIGCHNYMTKPLTPGTFVRDLLNVLIDIPELNLKRDND